MGLGGKFITTPKFTTGDISKSITRLDRDFKLKVYFAGGDEDEALDEPKPKLYVKSEWTPKPEDIPDWYFERTERFFSHCEKLFRRRRATPNLLPFQEQLKEDLLNNQDLLFPDTDKGLGPCAVHFCQYVEDGLIHLKNTEIYKQLTKQEAWDMAAEVKVLIEEWLEIHKDKLTKHERKYISKHLDENSSSPFGQFYILYKIHKGMKDGRWPTRPVCSDVSSLPHGLGKWITEMLLPVAQAQPSYFQDSFALKTLLDDLRPPWNALFFTSDARSMYTYIKTTAAIPAISAYLQEQAGVKFHHYDTDALLDALQIVFNFNIIKFGDTFWQQVSGTGMGISPAPPWATIYYALHENEFIPRWDKHLFFYKRFIDDVLGIWLCHPDPEENARLFTSFQEDMNNWEGLIWDFTPLSTTCNFMDLKLSIQGDRIVTSVFEKEMNLYLYLPPSSAHAKGVGTGLIFGHILRYRRLCTFQKDADDKIKEFIERLIARGHSRAALLPLFQRAEENAAAYLARTPAEHEETRHKKLVENLNQIYFHFQYHPEDPPASAIQRLWQEYISEPPGDTPLAECLNLIDAPMGPKKLIVAYSRPRNLRNEFSVRDISERGRPVSSFLAE